MSGAATELPIAVLRQLGSVSAEIVETLDWLVKARRHGERAEFYSKGGRLTRRGWDLRDYRPKLVENVGESNKLSLTELGHKVIEFRCQPAKKIIPKKARK